MNHSDDDIFGRNIDQLDRETPRFNLSEEEDGSSTSAGENKTKAPKQINKKMSTSSNKPPSVASVQPYIHPSNQNINPVMSPRLVKKTMAPVNDINRKPQPVPASYYNQQHYSPNTQVNNSYSKPKMPGFHSSQNPSTPAHLGMPRQVQDPNNMRPLPNSMPPPIQTTAPLPHHHHAQTNQHPHFMPSHQNVTGPEQPSICYCAECMHTQQMSERQKVEDEILIRQRELDYSWQEVEQDCPMDFTAHDRKKEILYAERNDPVQKPDIAIRRENKTVGNHTSAFPTAVSREHPVSGVPTTPSTNNSYGPPIIKTKQQAVVSPFTRGLTQKKVNINNVVREFSYPDETDAPQDYTSAVWPHSEMGSRIPSSERISLSPLCMSAVPSGIQTPVEPGTGTKPLAASAVEVVSSSSSSSAPPPPVTNGGVPSATPLQQLPGHDNSNNNNRGKNILDKFKGNEQYKPAVAVPPIQDSVKDFTCGRWIHLEMGSRIPSSEMISLSPLTMSGIPSGIQTPAEPNTGCIPLSANENITPSIVTTTTISERKISAKLDPNPNTAATAENESTLLRNDSSPDGYVLNKDGVRLRQKKPPPKNDEKLTELMSRINIDGADVPRYNYVDEDSVKNYGTPELSSRRQSYENLSFNGQWSAQTSGLVTPCDHGSIYGGIKPLRQQPLLEERSEDNRLHDDFSLDSVGTLSDSDNMGKSCDFSDDQSLPKTDQHNEEISRQQQSEPSSDIVQRQHIHFQHSLDVPGSYPQTTDKSSPQPQKQTTNRRTSCSSQESVASNRTDISTVVNASRSMHNTAPASPDPDGSEATDSSDSDNDESTEGAAGYAPKPSDMAAGQFPAQQRWHHDSSEQSRGVQGSEPTPKPGDPPISRKNLILMAKEQFPKQNQQQQQPPPPPSHGNHGNNENIHHHLQQSHPRFQYPSHQPPPPGAHYNNHHGAPPPQGYQHHYNPSHFNNYDRMNMMRPTRYSGYQQPNNLRHQQPPQGHRFKHPGYPTSAHDNTDFTLHANSHMQQHGPGGQMKPRLPISNNGMPAFPGGIGPRGMDTRHGMNARPQFIPPPHQQHGPRHFLPQQPPQGPRPSAMMNAQQPMNDFYDPPSAHNQQPQPKQPTQQPEDESGTQVDPAKPKNRAYSVTSLEPNRASPAHSDTLDTVSVVSFASMAASHQNLDTRADMMSSLLSMLGTHDPDDMARTLLAMSSSPDSCAAMRQSRCVPLLIQLLHNSNKESGEVNWGARQRASRALHNIVHSNSGDRRGKREVRVLRLLEIIREHTEYVLQEGLAMPPPKIRPDHGPGTAVAAIMKLSFDEEHKNSICELGGLQTVCELLAVDYRANKDTSDPVTISLRKYVGMVLINLTYNDAKNKHVLCNMLGTLKAVIGQLRLTDEEDLVQVFAGITRNISWRPDDRTQQALKAINAVRALMLCIQNLRSEVCIRSVLSAVWNLSAHNSDNKEEICRTPGSLKYLTYALSYRSPTNSLAVIENAGGILRNISSHIAINSDYRRTLRLEGCLQTLVTHLRFPSTRVVSNACGVLWNISARCVEDQDVLWELGAVSVLKTLIHSKHKSISASSAAALRNLLAVKPGSSGTDTESQLSFHHRSNSLPRTVGGGQYRRGDKKYRSVGAATRKDALRGKGKGAKPDPHQSMSQDESGPDRTIQFYYNDLYDNYPASYRDRGMNELRSPIMEEGCDNPPPYGVATGSAPKLYPLHKREDSFTSETTPSQYFFPADSGRLPMSAPINRRQMVKGHDDSSSSCSSFSPNDAVKPMPLSTRLPTTDKYHPTDLRGDEKPSLSEDVANDRCSPITAPVEMKPYDDCKLSVAKDAVMIYQGTPKLPVKASKATKDGKQKLMKLTSKMKRQKKSVDSLSSRDSLVDVKSDVETKKNYKETTVKDNFRTRTRVLKQRLLNKSHSSDLAFDKNLMNASKKKSPFDIYSMANFPDRVASDQCLSMTDRYLRDNMTNMQPPDMHHGSWSSCDVTQCRDERIYPTAAYQENFLPSPQLMSRMGHELNNGGQPSGGNFQSHSFLHGNHATGHGGRRTADSNYGSRSHVASASVEAMAKLSVHSATNDSAVESDRKTSKSKKSSLLKNPLKKKNKKKSDD